MDLRCVLGLAACLVLVGCRTYIPYRGMPLADATTAVKVIHDTLEQQPVHAPLEIEVTTEKFRLLRTQWNPVTGTHLSTTAVYFSKIADVHLSEKRGLYAVTILAVNGGPLLHVYASDLPSAERFIDSLQTMRQGTSGLVASP